MNPSVLNAHLSLIENLLSNITDLIFVPTESKKSTMKKNILFFYLCIPFLANTQVKEGNIISSTPTKYFTGLSLGVTNIIQNAVINGQNKVSNNQTFDLGLIFEKELNDRIKVSFRPGLAIGAVLNKFTINGNNYAYNYRITTFKAPVLLSYTFNKPSKFNGLPNYFLIGPELSYNLEGLNTSNRFFKTNGIYSKIPSFIKNKETQLKFVIGYDIKLKFVNFRPEFVYNHGFDVLKPVSIPDLNFTKIVNNQYSLNIVLSQRHNKVVYNKPTKTGPPLWKRLFL